MGEAPVGTYERIEYEVGVQGAWVRERAKEKGDEGGGVYFTLAFDPGRVGLGAQRFEGCDGGDEFLSRLHFCVGVFS